MAKQTLTQILGDFAYELSFKDLPSHIVERAQISLADGIACAFAGYPLPSSNIALDMWQDIKSEGNSTVWVKGEISDLESAAWVNCLLMHSVTHDDMQASTLGHMGSFVIPGSLAVAENEGKGGAELLAAMVAAYEVAGRIAVKSGQSIVQRGFRGSPVFGTFAAATATGKLLDLTRNQLQNAIALAANFSCGILEAFNTGSMEWRFQNGAALLNGIMAAKLAGKNLHAAPTTLEGGSGFFAAFGGSELKSEILAKKEKITETLGQEFEISKNFFKPYPTCGYNQIGVELAIVMMKQNSIQPEEIDRVNIFVSPENMNYPGVEFRGPFTSIDQALLSKPFSIAAAIKYQDLKVETYLNKLNDSEIENMAEKVFIKGTGGMGILDVNIEFKLKNGQRINGDQKLVNMANFTLNKDMIIDKFCHLTSNLLEKENANRLVSKIFNLTEMSNVSELFTELQNSIAH
jgi:2-methylcitrate dehydratase PrpD